jgi:hypothetical protein
VEFVTPVAWGTLVSCPEAPDALPGGAPLGDPCAGAVNNAPTRRITSAPTLKGGSRCEPIALMAVQYARPGLTPYDCPPIVYALRMLMVPESKFETNTSPRAES